MLEEKEINYKIDNSVFELETILKNYNFFNLLLLNKLLLHYILYT